MAVIAFTNEEGARFHPDMLGSYVWAGGMSVEAAHAELDADGAVLGTEFRSASAMRGRSGRDSCRRMPISNCISSRGRCWRVRAAGSGRSPASRGSAGSS
jgi:hypothetical protein